MPPTRQRVRPVKHPPPAPPGETEEEEKERLNSWAAQFHYPRPNQLETPGYIAKTYQGQKVGPSRAERERKETRARANRIAGTSIHEHGHDLPHVYRDIMGRHPLTDTTDDTFDDGGYDDVMEPLSDDDSEVEIIDIDDDSCVDIDTLSVTPTIISTNTSSDSPISTLKHTTSTSTSAASSTPTSTSTRTTTRTSTPTSSTTLQTEWNSSYICRRSRRIKALSSPPSSSRGLTVVSDTVRCPKCTLINQVSSPKSAMCHVCDTPLLPDVTPESISSSSHGIATVTATARRSASSKSSVKCASTTTAAAPTASETVCDPSSSSSTSTSTSTSTRRPIIVPNKPYFFTRHLHEQYFNGVARHGSDRARFHVRAP